MQLVFQDDQELSEEIQLDPIGPQTGDCIGPIKFPKGTHLDAITATYTTSGIGSLIFNIDGNDSVPLGAQNEAQDPDVEITKWEFNRQREFAGFQTW